MSDVEATGTCRARLPHRGQFIAGLRALADLLEADDTMTLPYHGILSPITVYTRDGSALAAYAAVMTEKHVEVAADPIPRFRLRITGRIGGVALHVSGDPDWLQLPKLVKGTRVVEDVDYDFSSLLTEPVTA